MWDCGSSHGAGLDRDRPTLVRLGSAMAGRGYVAVSIDYRQEWQNLQVAPEFEPFLAAYLDSFPGNEPRQIRSWVANVEDVTLAYRWMVEQSAALQIDPERIALGGYSRGSSVSLLATYAINNFGIDLDPPVCVLWDQAGR